MEKPVVGSSDTSFRLYFTQKHPVSPVISCVVTWKVLAGCPPRWRLVLVWGEVWGTRARSHPTPRRTHCRGRMTGAARTWPGSFPGLWTWNNSVKTAHNTILFASYFKLFMLRTCWEWERDSMLPTSLPHPDSALTIAFIVLQSESSVSLLDTRWGFLPILFSLQ